MKGLTIRTHPYSKKNTKVAWDKCTALEGMPRHLSQQPFSRATYCYFDVACRAPPGSSSLYSLAVTVSHLSHLSTIAYISFQKLRRFPLNPLRVGETETQEEAGSPLSKKNSLSPSLFSIQNPGYDTQTLV